MKLVDFFLQHMLKSVLGLLLLICAFDITLALRVDIMQPDQKNIDFNVKLQQKYLFTKKAKFDRILKLHSNLDAYSSIFY